MISSTVAWSVRLISEAQIALGFEIHAIVVDEIELPYVTLVLERHYDNVTTL